MSESTQTKITPLELKKKLYELTKINIDTLQTSKEISKDFEFHYAKDIPLTHSKANKTYPVPLNLIFRAIFDPSFNCKNSSNENINFQEFLQNKKNVRERSFSNKTFEEAQIPPIFKENIKENFKKITNTYTEEMLEKINEEINNKENYPKTFEYSYKYILPMKKKVFLGPSELNILEEIKIYLISPICFIAEKKNFSSGFMNMDSFYTVMQYKFDMELNDDLTLNKTIFNQMFNVVFTKSTWMESKIKSNTIATAEEGYKEEFLPNFNSELNLNMEEICKPDFKEKKIFINNGAEGQNSDVIENSDMSECEIPPKKNFAKKLKEKDEKKNNGSISDAISEIKNSILFIFLFAFILYFIGRINSAFPNYVFMACVLYFLHKLNKKLNN